MGLKRNILSAFSIAIMVCGSMSLPSFAAGDHLITMQQADIRACLLYTSPSPRDKRQSRMPSSA